MFTVKAVMNSVDAGDSEIEPKTEVIVKFPVSFTEEEWEILQSFIEIVQKKKSIKFWQYFKLMSSGNSIAVVDSMYGATILDFSVDSNRTVMVRAFAIKEKYNREEYIEKFKDLIMKIVVEVVVSESS